MSLLEEYCEFVGNNASILVGFALYITFNQLKVLVLIKQYDTKWYLIDENDTQIQGNFISIQVYQI